MSTNYFVLLNICQFLKNLKFVEMYFLILNIYLLSYMNFILFFIKRIPK